VARFVLKPCHPAFFVRRASYVCSTQLLSGMSAVFASYQTDQQGHDIRLGHQRRVESGLPLGRQYGYHLVRVNGRSIVEHDPIQAPKVRRIFELFAYSPLTIDSLVDTLARQGIVYTDRQPKFTRSTLHRLLHNRSYVGEVWYQTSGTPVRSGRWSILRRSKPCRTN
jgi:hypothetical protein